ncbi:Metallo-hydrolase/oxidoreductase [Aureobasidium subglaciale]|nr:Metallo-hydrolase/oxidoreductase [Aureobasidium subglaciale]
MTKNLVLDPSHAEAPTRDHQHYPSSLPEAKETKLHPTNAGGENASLYFVGTATTILEWEGVRIMTDPNFLHAGDHVHLGPGVTGTRQTNPALDLHELPRIDAVLLSHYHADHFDEKVEASLRRSLPIITTPHAKDHLTSKGEDESFSQVYDLDFFQSMYVDIRKSGTTHEASNKRVPAVKVTGMPGKHVPQGMLSKANDLLGAVPPTNGWMLELGYKEGDERISASIGAVTMTFERQLTGSASIYISGDTLLVDELKEIPERYKGQNIDLMLIHLGGTTIPSPKLPLLMVTMDAKQGIELVRLINPDLTIPIHYDDYDVFLSPLDDFKKEMERAGLSQKVVYLDRKDQYKFAVQQGR